jgi:hypothetical protein
MNKIFKFLFFILFLEIFLGYVIYLKNSTLVSGHYVSSTIKQLEKISIFIDKKKPKKKEDSLVKQKNEKEDTLVKQKKEIEDTLVKEQKKNTLLKQPKVECSIYFKENQHIDISGITSFKQPMSFQSTLNFLNLYDEKKDFLILIMGNSETLGNFIHNSNNRLHILLQDKLRDKFKSKNIFTVNLGSPGGVISDHLRHLLSFSEIYKPDLVIFYTGGNELVLTDWYEQIVKNYAISKKNFNSYKFKTNNNNLQICLDEDLYLTKSNFDKDEPILDIERHIKFHFENIKKILENKSIEFLFYIQPFNKKEDLSNLTKINYPKIANLDIKHEKFINLNIKDKKFINLNIFDLSTEIEYVDLFHTIDAKKVSEKISKNIIDIHKENILKKISR